MGRPDYIFVNSEKPRDAAMRNTGAAFVVLSHHSLLPCDAVRCTVLVNVILSVCLSVRPSVRQSITLVDSATWFDLRS